jgi:hypothetical protein
MHSTIVTRIALIVFTIAPVVRADDPLRIDLSAATGRRDAETFSWHEWEIDHGAEAEKQFDAIDVKLLSQQGEITGFLHKPALATGATLGADGIRCTKPIEIVLVGLRPGRHSLITYHNTPNAAEAPPVLLEIAGKRCTAHPSRASSDNAGVSAAFLEFEVAENAAITARLSVLDSDDNAELVLNGLEIDGDDPRYQARRPVPGDFDEHVDGETGRVTLRWEAADSTVSHLVYLTQNRDWNVAKADALEANHESSYLVGETADTNFPVDVDPHDSLQHYCWRVDSVDADGNVTRGDVWSFRARHLAFPGAEGYGRFAIGGRGGKVIKVTNLNDSGPGSFRAAVEATGPRTIVFEVGGRIHLKNRLALRDNYVTIAGHTAPGKGICISNYNFGMLGAHDNIIRFIRVRPGNTSGETLDGMGMASTDHSIIDHCSISWTQDESFSSRGAKNITLQRTLISEALNIAGHRKYEDGKQHGYAASISGDIGSFHHNLLAHCAGRNWSLAGAIDQANIHAGRLDIRNNVVYNWGYRTTDGGAKKVQFVNNYYKPGPATTVFHVLKPERNHAFGPQDYYVAGNVMEGRYDADQALAGVIEPRDEPLTEFVYDEPFFPPYVDTQSAEAAYHDVLSDVGCNVPMLDDHDRRVLRETRDGTTTYVGSRSGLPGLPDAQEDVGGWEDYPEVSRPEGWDRDGDGMPDAWEVSHGWNPADASDGIKDEDGDGYTNLEQYLHSLLDDQSR